MESDWELRESFLVFEGVFGSRFVSHRSPQHFDDEVDGQQLRGDIKRDTEFPCPVKPGLQGVPVQVEGFRSEAD